MSLDKKYILYMTLIFESSTCHLPGGRRTAVVHIYVVKYIKSYQPRFQSKERGAAKTENPVPRSSFAPKPHGNACYVG